MEVDRVYRNKGYWAIVIGGSSGLGWATVKQLAAQGMHIAMVHRDRKTQLKKWLPEWEELQSCGVRTLRWNTNALNDGNIQQIGEELQAQMGEGEQVRVMVHALSRGNLKELGGKNALSTQDLSLTVGAMGINYYRWATVLRDRMLFQDGSRCLGFTSAGNQRVWKYYAAVSAAKNVLESLMRSMAMEWGPEGIRSNLIQAGITDTPSLRAIPGHETLIEQSAKRNPLGRQTEPEDVARVVDLLCRGEADWINGAIIPVDGGETLI